MHEFSQSKGLFALLLLSIFSPFFLCSFCFVCKFEIIENSALDHECISMRWLHNNFGPYIFSAIGHILCWKKNGRTFWAQPSGNLGKITFFINRLRDFLIEIHLWRKWRIFYNFRNIKRFIRFVLDINIFFHFVSFLFFNRIYSSIFYI